MSEHLSQIQLAGYGSRTLDADELLMVDRHLASCDACYERFTRTLDQTRPYSDAQSSQSIEEPFHLDYDQHLAPYVDGTSNDIDREIVESHVALCSECADDLRDLQEFRQQPVWTTAPKPLPGRDWMVQWHWPRLLNPQLTALAIVVLILVITAAVVLWTTQRSQRPVEQAVHPQAPEVDKDKASSSSGSEGNNAEKVAAQPSPGQQEDRPDQSKPQREEPLIALNDGGGQVTLDQSGRVAGLQSLPPDLKKNVEAVLATREFRVTQTLAALLPGSGRLRGGGSEDNMLMPLGPTGIVIESDRPTFRWRALAGGRDYVVTIYDSRLRSVQNSGPLEATEWTTSKPLDRGITYSWQISAVKDGKTIVAPKPPLPQARFRVLDRNGITALEHAKRVHGQSHLVMGVLYCNLGLLNEAEREFEALLQANPSSPVAAQLLANLKSLRRK